MNKFTQGDVVSGRIRNIRRAILPAGLPVHPDKEDVEVFLVVLYGHPGCFILMSEMTPAPSWLKIADVGNSFVSPLPSFSIDLVCNHNGFIEAMRKTTKKPAKKKPTA